MKNSLPRILPALVGLVLLIVSAFLFLTNSPESGSRSGSGENPAAAVSAVPAVHHSSAENQGKPVPAGARDDARKSSAVPAVSPGIGPAVQPPAPSPGRSREDVLLEKSEVLAEKTSKPVKDAQVSAARVRIIRNKSFKYPLLRVVEELNDEGEPIKRKRSVMVADHFIFKKAEALSEEAFAQKLEEIGLAIRRKMLAPDTYLVEIPVSNPMILLNIYEDKQKDLNQIGRAEPDYIVHAQDFLPADPGFNSLWGLRNVTHSLTLPDQSPPQVYQEDGSMLYGGAIPAGGISADLIDCDDGESGDFPAAVNGNIAFIRRGTATFPEMATNAQAAGAIAVVLANNVNGSVNGTLLEVDDWAPFVVISKSAGDTVKPLLPEPAVLNAEDTERDIDAPQAWDLNRGSRDVLVGVIDTGIDYTHPDLAPNMWTNPGETGFDGQGRDKTINGVDDDGNGFIDDVHGYDFVNRDGDPDDDHFHGTHCAGTIGAVGDNDLGVVGVNWEVSIMGLKFLDSQGSGALSDGVDAVHYATLMGVDLTSNSYGGGSPLTAMQEAIEDANENGVLFVAAAGNSATSSPMYPAGYDNENIISVAAIDRNDNLAGFSNYGLPHTDIGAPGVSILSTYPTDHSDGPYHAISGTSMATPHVAGVAALIFARAPSIPHLDVREQILSSAVPIPALDGEVAGGGRLNAFAALSGVSETARYELLTLGADDTAGNGDGVLNPGETISLAIEIFNYGYQDAEGVTAGLSTTSGWLTVTDATSAFLYAKSRD